MDTNRDPKELAVALLNRSKCAVQVAAVLADAYGVFGWGWNSSGPTGLGEHAEAHCLKRSNRGRVGSATLYVAARRSRKSGNRMVTAKPCSSCQQLIKECRRVVYRDGLGRWVG